MISRRVAVRGIFVHEGKMLAAKLKPYRHKNASFWSTIGGGIDDGESLSNAISREIVEETGIQPRVGRLLYIQQFFDKNKNVEQMEFFFLIDNPEDYLSIDLSKTSHGAVEIESIDFIDPSDPQYGLLPDFLRSVDPDNLPQQTEIFSYI